MDIYYLNSRNEKLDFKTLPYKTRKGNFMDNKWDFSLVNDRVKTLNKKPIERKLEIDVFSKEKEAYYNALNHLANVTDYDNGRNQKGKLFINDYHVKCNLVSSEKAMWESNFPLLQNVMSVLIEDPMWIKEKVFSFFPSTNDKSEEGQKKYTYTYPFVYGGSGGTSTIKNNAVIESNVIIRIYGQVSNPAVNISGNTYQVFVDVEKNERLEIDTNARTIFLIKEDGSKLRKFDKQNRNSDVFKRLNEGSHDVIWNDTFKFDVVVQETRSEPEWR